MIRTQVVLRLLQLIGVLLAAAAISFAAQTALPLDLAEIRVGARSDLTTEQRDALVARVREDLGLDHSPVVQFGLWLRNVATLDFGTTGDGRPVLHAVRERLLPSVELVVASILVSLPTALLLALASVRPGSRRFARLIDVSATAGFALPPFWIGILLVLLFAVRLQWLPASGFTPWTQGPVDHLRHLVLPTLTLALPQVTIYYRYLREGLETALRSQYVRSARARGLSERTVLTRHALPNALLPTLTVLGMQFGALIGGIIVIESVFSWPGVGSLLTYSAQRDDYNTLVAIVLFIAATFVIISAALDLLQLYLDPRTRRPVGP